MMESNFPFLMSMKDKTIQVYKGGPESKTGKLLYVKSDYLALETKDGNVIYYQLSHLKSVIEDSKGNPLFIDSDEQEEDEDSIGDFVELLNSFILQDIQVNQGGPESRSGMLLLVRPDYLAISTKKDGVVYYNLEHIKSICEAEEEEGESSEKGESAESSESSSSSSSSSEEVTEWEEVVVEDNLPPCAFEENFNDLLSSFNQRWVTINSGGPEKVEGVLIDCSHDYVTLVHNKDVFKIATFHIKTVQVASTEEEEESSDNESSNNQDESADEKNDDDNNETNTGDRRNKGPNPFKQGYRGRR